MSIRKFLSKLNNNTADLPKMEELPDKVGSGRRSKYPSEATLRKPFVARLCFLVQIACKTSANYIYYAVTSYHSLLSFWFSTHFSFSD
jgi:hypothetical protein